MTLGSKDSVQGNIEDVQATIGKSGSQPSLPVTMALGRLAGLDALRGLMLTIVLADHCGGMLTEGRFIRQWTLMGLGWSDAAEAFVFLSGFTFGWVYIARIERHGACLALRQGMLRTIQIYSAYLATVIAVAILHQLRQVSERQVTMGTLGTRVMDALLLMEQPYAVGILCLYVICLPITLFSFVAFGRDKSRLLLLLSFSCYSLVQVYPVLNLRSQQGGWFFNPFAWQLLMVCGALLGRESRYGRALTLPSKTSQAIAILTAFAAIAISLLFRKGDLLIGAQSMDRFESAIGYSQWQYEWLGKTTLGPLRLLHFAAVAYLVSVFAPLRSACWSHWSQGPLRACGRHSLEVYCIGVILTHALAFAPTAFSSTPLRAILLTALVLAIQYVVATLFANRSQKTKTG